jgi:glycine/D-amino acid oxidase-like deaminating enzyme/nitrite reductase/ring-hydroxylating ferredoxin subunit
MQPDSKNDYPSGNTASLWMGTFPTPDYPRLTRDRRCDVCIVGAGIAGLSTAYMLAKEGKKVIVLDDGPIGGGESGRTTAHLTAAMDDRIYELERVHGEDRARLVVESHLAAINRIEEIVRLEGIDCDFQRVDGYLFLGGEDRESVLEREYEAARKAGFADVSLVDRAPIASWNSGTALRFPEQAQFHPLKYLTGLARAIEANGGEIFCGTHVSSVNGGAPCTVETDDEKTVTADAVCVCTNGSITDMVSTHAKQAPYRTYAIAAVIPRGAVSRALYWDTPDPYHYVRVQQLDEPVPGALKGDTLYDALIVGGEDHKTAHENDAEERWECLEQWTRQRWPQAREVIYRWSGQVLEPNDYVAFIGKNPDGAENVYMASGDSGQGMTHGTIAGMLLSDLVAGRENRWSDLYDPKRVTVRPQPIEEFAKENLDVAVQFIKERLTPSDVPTEADIARGEGRVMRKGTRRVAVYRDESGTLHYRSAACTHLKCIVAWNSAEKSWDCGCHGSRFDALGKVLNGPAIEDLSPWEEGEAAAARRREEDEEQPDARP